MTDSKDTAENQVPATSDTPVAPEATPETVSEDASATAELVVADPAAATEPDDAEPVVVTADATTVSAGAAEPVMAAAVASPAGSRGKRTSDRPKRGPVRPEGPAPLGHYAVIETGGKQYRVSVGDLIAVERLEGDAGSEVTIDRVLMVGGNGEPKIGAPMLEGAAVTATIETQYRGEKIIVFKMKPKKRYRRRTGHRQSLTRLAITAINA